MTFSYCPCYQHETLISAPRDDISRGLMTRAIWKRPCINLFITYFVRADNMVLPFTRGHITWYCSRKMLLPRRQITRRKLCFYNTWKFGVIPIQYVIMYNIMLFVLSFIIFHKWYNISPEIQWIVKGIQSLKLIFFGFY